MIYDWRLVLEVIFNNVMCSINQRFTYLLTYLLVYGTSGCFGQLSLLLNRAVWHCVS